MIDRCGRWRAGAAVSALLIASSCTGNPTASEDTQLSSTVSGPNPSPPESSTSSTTVPASAVTTSTSVGPDRGPFARRLELSSPAEYRALAVEQVYVGSYADEEFGVGRLEEQAGLPVGPAGFGVDERGVVYVADGVRRRVLQLADGHVVGVDDYSELAPSAFQAFAVAPDGTQYISLNDGLAIADDGEVTARLSMAELGWDGIHRSLTASPRGVWTRLPQGPWTLAADSTAGVSDGVASPSDSRPDVSPQHAVNCRIEDAGELAVTIGENPDTAIVTTPAGVGGVVACTSLSNGVVLIALVDQTDPSTLVVVSMAGTQWSVGTVDLPEENMLLNGPYVVVSGDDRMYIEMGSLDEVEVVTVTPNVPSGPAEDSESPASD